MPRKLTKKELGQLQLSTGWTEEELNDPAVLAIRRQLEEQASQREQLARNPFSDVEGAVDTVPAVPEQAETGGLSALLASLDESVARNRQAHRDALVGGGKRSLGAAMQAAEEHGAGGVASILDALYEQFNLEGGGAIGNILRTIENPDQPSLAEKGAGLFREGSQQVTQAYDASQRNTSGFGRQLSGAAVDALSSPSSVASLTGIPSAAGLAGLDTYAQEYASARGEGLPQASADKRAIGQGGIELLFESLPTGKIAERILPAEARRRLMGDARKVALETLASMGVEGLGEAATGGGQMLFDKAIAETTDDKQLAKFASDQLPKDAAGVAEALWRNARAGSAMAGAVAGPTAALDAAFDRARTASELIGAANKAILERDGRTSDVKPTNAITPTAPPPAQGELFAPGTGTFEQAQAERQKTLETNAGITVGRKKAAIEEGRAARLEGILSELDQARQQQEPLQEKVEALGPRASEQDLSSLAAANRRVRALETEYQQVQAQQETARTAEAPKPVTAPAAPAQQQDLFAEQEAAELRKQKTAELLKRNEAKKLVAADTKGIQASAKSSRAAARRKFLAELSVSTRSLPEDQRIDAIAQATTQWDNANPLSAFVAAASQPKAARKAKPKKSKKVDTAPTDEVDTTTTPADLLKRFDGLSQESLDSPESPAPKNSGSIEHVFRAMLKKVGKGDVKVLNKMMQDGNIKVVEDASFLPQASSENTKGNYDGKTLYIVAGNLNADNIIGDMLSVAAHETKHAADLADGDKAVKSSLRALVGDEANKRLVSKIEALATEDREVGTLVNALKSHYPNRKVYNLELAAHFLNHALDKRDNTFLVKRVMDDAVSAIMVAAKKKLGIDDVNLKDVAYLARQLVTEAAVAGERLTTTPETFRKKTTDDGLDMIGGASASGFMPAARDGRVYIGKVDGLPRFEFSDHESAIDNGAFDILKKVSTKRQGIPLGSLLDHPELYRQYPELQDYTVTIDNSIGKVSSNASGYFSGNGKNLLAISPKTAKNVNETRSILLHEVQHAIQEIEGHDPGASSKQFENPTIKNAYNAAQRTYERFLEDVSVPTAAANTLPPSAATEFESKVSVYNRRRMASKNKKKTPTIKELTDFRKDLFLSDYAELSSDSKLATAGRQYREVKEKFDEATRAWDKERSRAWKEYLRVYGETEARTTQLRRNLTPEEREILSPEGDMRYAFGKVPVEETTRSPKAMGTIEESVDDSFEERRQKKLQDEAVPDSPEGLDFLPRKYTVGNTAAKEALRVAERLLWSGGFTNSVLKEITLHASHLPASLMVKATKYGNDMLTAIDRNAAAAGKGKSADEQRKIRQRLRVDLGKEIERIDQLPTRAERDSALDALDRSERFRGIGQAVRAIRDFKMELTRELFELRQRDPKPLTQKETAVYTKMIENAERYTTRAYLATYNDKIGIKYGKNLWKRFERDPDSLEGRIVQRALDYLMSRELIIPDTESLHKLGTAQLRRMHENWIGGTSSFKGEKGRNQMIRALSRLPEHTQEEINAKAVEIVKDMLNLNKNKGISARFYSIGAKQNRTILEARSDIPPELRALMGEITDPFLREAISLQRMINLSAKTKLLTEVFEAGASRGWWSDIKTDEHETQLNDIAYGPMNGKWINRDLEDALTGTVMSLESTDKMIADAIHNPTAFSQFLAGKSVRLLTGLSRVQKTYRIVYSLAQMVFNGVGAFANIALNGIVNPKTMARGMHNAFLVLSSEINSKILNERNLPTVQEIVRAGVIDSATVGEFKSQAYENITEQIKKLDPDQPGYAQKVMHVLWNFVSAQGDLANAVRQVYAFMDIWTKVATYHDRKQFLTEFSEAEGLNWSEETIQRRAGYEASSTNISYERAFPLAKIIEKNLPFGMFLTYFAEVPRTIGTSYLQVLADANLARNAKTKEGRKLATTKATLRFAGTNAALLGVVAATLNALDNDDEEEKKRRRLDPEWMQNKFTLPIGVDSEGNTVLFEVNRFDPNGPLNEAIVSVLSSPPEEKAEALYNQVIGLFVPAQGAIAVYRILHDMVIEAGARATGNASLYDKDMRSKRTVLERNYPEQFAKLRHLLGYGDLGENTVAAIEALWLPASVQPLVDQKGKVVEVRPGDVDMENVPQALGYRPYVRNPDLSLEFRVKDYNNEMKAIMRDRGKLLRDAHQLDESTLVRELGDMVAREKEAFDKLRYNFEGYMAYEDKTLKDAATHFDSNKLFAQVRYNKFRPRVVSQESLRDWAKQQIKEGRDKQEVKQVYTLLRRLYTESGNTEID